MWRKEEVTYLKLMLYILFLITIGIVTIISLPITIPCTILYFIGDAVYSLFPKKPKDGRRATY